MVKIRPSGRITKDTPADDRPKGSSKASSKASSKGSETGTPKGSPKLPARRTSPRASAGSSPISVAKAPAKAAAKAPAAPTKIRMEDLPSFKKQTATTEEAADRAAKTKAKKVLKANTNAARTKPKSPTPPPIKTRSARKGTKTGTKGTGSGVKKSKKAKLSSEEAATLRKHRTALTGLINRMIRTDEGAWTDVVAQLEGISERLIEIQEGDFERAAKEDTPDEDPVTKGKSGTRSKRRSP